MKNILLIDTNKDFLETMHRYLSWHEFNITTSQDSSSVITYCQDNPVDLCILDAYARPLNGFQVAGLIRTHQNEILRKMKLLITFEEDPPLNRFIFMKENDINTLMKYVQIERWVEKITAII